METLKIAALAFIFLVACGDDASPPPILDGFVPPLDMGTLDASTPPDLGIDAGSETPDLGHRDMKPENDSGPPDMGPPDTGPPPTPDMGPPDMGPADSGPPDMGPPPEPDMGPPVTCSGVESVALPLPSSETWSRSYGATNAPTLRVRGPLRRVMRYRLGVKVEADDPRERIMITVVCPVSVQDCADQNDISRKINAPTPGHDVCQTEGIGEARMGVSCTFDDPPVEIQVQTTAFLRMPESDPGYCNPSSTIEAFPVDVPSRPSEFP